MLNGTCVNQTEFDVIKTLFKEKSQNFKLGVDFNRNNWLYFFYELIIVNNTSVAY